jgi:ribosome maturation factor RimP
MAPGGAAAGAADAVTETVLGLGYELVDVERAGRGLLRVTIDRVPGRAYPGGPGEFVTVEDCEAVTRQLQYALEVAQVAYERLEVSSPGLDRPLRTAADYLRFAGHDVALALKAPLAGRKHFTGRLGVPAEGEGSAPPAQAAAPAGAAETSFVLVFTGTSGEQELRFTPAEVREARLVPVIDFKGRRGAAPAAPALDQTE